MLFTCLLFTAWAVAVAWYDCRSRRIPNALVLAGLLSAAACAWMRASPFGVTPAQMMWGALVGLIALLPFFLLGVMGAADVKVFAALGAWCGMHALLGLWVAASLAAGVHALSLLIAARMPLALSSRRGPTFAIGSHRSTPYAACLAVPAVAWLAVQMLTRAGS